MQPISDDKLTTSKICIAVAKYEWNLEPIYFTSEWTMAKQKFWIAQPNLTPALCGLVKVPLSLRI